MNGPSLTAQPIIVTRVPGDAFAFIDATMGAAAPPDNLRHLIRSNIYGGQFTGGEHGLWRIPAGAADHFAGAARNLGFPLEMRDRFPEPEATPTRWECANPDCRGPITPARANRWRGCPHCDETHPPVPSPPPASAPFDQRMQPDPAA